MEEAKIVKHRRLILLKVDLPALMAFVFFAALIFFYLIPGFEKVMMDRKRNMIREMTASAVSILEYYNTRITRDGANADEAMMQARQAISTIRYGEAAKDYFWITDTMPRMIMHPYRTDLDGQDLSGFRDQKGKLIFVEFVNAVRQDGASYVEYMWQWNDDSTRIVPKLSYVKLFEPWNWIVGTGIYIEDVRSEIRRIELKAMMISGVMGFVIIILLVIITRQSHKIESKRRKAEEELHRSRELYRTLAEAATEGVLIWSAAGLQANKTLLSWLGYTGQDLLGLPVSSVLRSSCAAEYSDAGSFYSDLELGQQDECSLVAANGSLIEIHAGYSRISLGEDRAVMMVFRPLNQARSASASPASLLAENLNTGFFRISAGRRNKFLYASGYLVRMLGYSSLQELMSKPVEYFFAKPGQFRHIRSSLVRGESILRMEVHLRSKEGGGIWALLNAVVVDSSGSGIWCEGTVEPIVSYSSGAAIIAPGIRDLSIAYLLKIQVKQVMQSLIMVNEETPLGEAVNELLKSSSDAAVVMSKKAVPAGVLVTRYAFQRLLHGENPAVPVSAAMHTPPVLIHGDLPLGQAVTLINDSPARCVIVISGNNIPSGIITDREISESLSKLPDQITAGIEKASTTGEFAAAWHKCRDLAVLLTNGNADPFSVTRLISEIADRICTRIISVCIDEAGSPPCRFAFIQTGSAGRMEQTFSTDQDNAIIYESADKENTEHVNAYFLMLGRRVNEMLSEAGFRSCKGENMAGNPKWCQPLDVWKKYFTDWIRMPGPEELLGISIFFDFRFCYGDLTLVNNLREYISTDLSANDIFFHHMTSAWVEFSRSLRTITGRSGDIKKYLMPLTGIARLYALKHSVSSYSTIERLVDLSSAGIIERSLMLECARAWKNLTAVRLGHQAGCIASGAEPDNIVNFGILEAGAMFNVTEALRTIDELILKASQEFYVRNI